MSYRSLGHCGAKVSIFGLGGWTTFGESVQDEHLVREILTAAFDRGVNYFDIADAYARGGAEAAMGKTLRTLPRHELVIASKVWAAMSDDINDRGLSRKHIMESIEKSLKRIGTDYLDLYFCHRFDEETPLEETARAMDDLVHQGKILYWGTSQWTGPQIVEAYHLCEHRNLYRPQAEQPLYNLLARKSFEQDVRGVAIENGMGVVVYSPLASGVLTGKYDNGIPENSRLARHAGMQKGYGEEEFQKVRALKEFADSLGCTRAQLALAWVAAQPGVSSVITGATRVEHVVENLAALSVAIPDDLAGRISALFPA